MSRSTKKAEAEVKLWNQLCPSGTEIQYIPFSARSIPIRAKTSGPAWVLTGVGAVVAVEGDRDAVPLARCRVITEAATIASETL